MNKTKVSYALTRRQSQSRIASAYIEMLAERYEMVNTQDRADIVIVHHPPRNYETVYALHPALKGRYVISCCVCHADDVPSAWQRNLARVQEVWTCSRFCHDVISRYHPKVTYIPYVIERDTSCSAGALGCIQRMIGFEPDSVYFLTIASLDEPRKNVHELVESFKKVSKSMPKARLLVKSTQFDKPTWSPHPQVLFLPLIMPFEYISALYQLSDIYVSAHHAESWGLTMSDAMLFRKPVMATGYSGNMDYMRQDNSFLLSYDEGVVPSTPGVAVEAGMRWADPHKASIEETLLRLYLNHDDLDTTERVARASEDIKKFNRPFVADLIHRSIEAVAAG
jgi:glycosyltransferase involved in cell wall biosynthesis